MLPILFLGPSWDDLLFPFQIGFFGSIACGIGALLALEREDRRGDLVAARPARASASSAQHVGIPFVVAATSTSRSPAIASGARSWSRSRPRSGSLWYLGWGREASNFISFHNFQTLIGYVADGLASSLSTLLGLAVPRDEMAVSSLDWGRPLLVIAIGVGVWRVARVGIAAMPRAALGGARRRGSRSGR